MNKPAAEKVSPTGPAGASAARFNSSAGPLNNLATKRPMVPTKSVSPTDGRKRGTDFNEPQPVDFPTLPQLLTSLVGGLFWLGLSFGFVVLLGLRVGAI